MKNLELESFGLTNLSLLEKKYIEGGDTDGLMRGTTNNKRDEVAVLNALETTWGFINGFFDN